MNQPAQASSSALKAKPEPLSYLYEIPLFYVLLIVLEHAYFPEKTAFRGVEPHPYWLGILLFSLRYGPGPGLMAGALSAACYLGGVWRGGERYLFEDFDFYLLPGLFIAVGAAVGASLDGFRRAVFQRDGDLTDHKTRLRELADEVEIERKAHRALEQHVVSQMSSLVTLYSGARGLGSLDPEALFEGILDFFTQALKARRTSLYVREGDLWALHSHRGWSVARTPPAQFGFAEGLVGRAGSENKVISLRDYSFGEGGRPGLDAVMAGPLRRGDGQVAAVFCVQDIPLLKFNSATINLLTLLLDWAQEAIAKCHYFEELKSKSIMDEDLNVYHERYFWSRARQEFGRSKAYALPFSVLLVSLESPRDLPKAQELSALRILSCLLNETCRGIDIVAKYSEPGIPFAILMITATAERARERLKTSILKAFEAIDLFALSGGGQPLKLKIGIGSYAPNMANVEMMIEQAKNDIAAVSK